MKEFRNHEGSFDHEFLTIVLQGEVPCASRRRALGLSLLTKPTEVLSSFSGEVIFPWIEFQSFDALYKNVLDFFGRITKWLMSRVDMSID